MTEPPYLIQPLCVLNVHNVPIVEEDYGKWHEWQRANETQCRVGSDVVKNIHGTYWISTKFFGQNCLWETMVFEQDKDCSFLDIGFGHQAATEELAMEAHRNAIMWALLW